MIDDVEAFARAAEVLRERGAYKIYVMATHGLLSSDAPRIIDGSFIDEVVVTNTIPLSANAQSCSKIRQLSVAPLIAETIQRIARGDSVMSLFSDQDNLF